MDDKGLDIKVVVQRFAQSTEALEKLSEKLNSLTSSSESISRANQSVSEASLQIQKIVQEFSQMTGAMRDAGSKIENAANVASLFLSQTDLSTIGIGLDSILVLLNGKISNLESQVIALSEVVHQKDLELVTLRAELDFLRSKKWYKVNTQ